MTTPPYLRAQPAGTVLAVKVQPRASANEFCGEQGGELKVRVTAPPVDSAANDAVVRFLAETLGCSRQRVELMRGETSRHKLILLHGWTPSEAAARLAAGG